jgi:hypothetical protein
MGGVPDADGDPDGAGEAEADPEPDADAEGDGEPLDVFLSGPHAAAVVNASPTNPSSRSARADLVRLGVAFIPV